ncbi:MAG TPA: Crp/Fnr family transcriptional regulator [Stellaceae bacterium]|nr:Crp/Fnr family transcriptional regulator [Stellaceae bacterium]
MLSALSDGDFAELANDLQPVSLPKHHIVYDVGAPLDYVYFLESGLVSVLTIMEDGASSEVGMIGAEGLLGAPALLGGTTSAQQVVVQVAGSALRIPIAACRAAFDGNERIRATLLRFVEGLLNLSAQIGGCNRLHSVEQRTARWLLMACDRIGSDILPLTQEFLAAMLGVRRSGVSEAAAELQRSGLISYRRGMITLTDRAKLEKTACECYQIDKQRIRQP